MNRKNFEFLRKRALELGAKEAKIISISTVKTGAWVFYKCKFGCSGFAERLTCPPYSPSPKQTREILASYKKGLLLHTNSKSKVDISKIAVALEKEAFFRGYYKAFAMGAGPCRFCNACNTQKACRRPDGARPSMEACGIDVFRTVRNNGFCLKTLDSVHCKANYFALVLID